MPFDDLSLRIVRAALHLAATRMRGQPRPEPETYSPTALEDSAGSEAIPAELHGEVERLAGAFRFFAESVRVAERKDGPIIPLVGEKIPPRRSSDKER